VLFQILTENLPNILATGWRSSVGLEPINSTLESAVIVCISLMTLDFVDPVSAEVTSSDVLDKIGNNLGPTTAWRPIDLVNDV